MSAVEKPKSRLIGDLISEAEFCEEIGMSLMSAYKLRVNGKISFYKIMGKVYYSQEHIADYLRTCERRAKKAHMREIK